MTYRPIKVFYLKWMKKKKRKKQKQEKRNGGRWIVFKWNSA